MRKGYFRSCVQGSMGIILIIIAEWLVMDGVSNILSYCMCTCLYDATADNATAVCRTEVNGRHDILYLHLSLIIPNLLLWRRRQFIGMHAAIYLYSQCTCVKFRRCISDLQGGAGAETFYAIHLFVRHALKNTGY
jgi:hypothetical protein